ncbi:uncharacterized protein EV420DRAFT_1472695 [Desarmillaria tabescens]|uniref:Uncharacterized protein n=1 Tax=Armillaria tabescens TaxID=1929756 RepID=A0AA39TXT3_ARMTA|nr:uncharacterized protein EV420DRAFT_1472695 [Desarmillaria tabescens]KAK0469468.1 hypothetical protein EV420DRAFT_1472695 [Desarmillaria tabescens]
MREQDHPLGWVVGPPELQIHVFRPDVSESRALFIDRKARELVAAVKRSGEDVEQAQKYFQSILNLVNGNYMVLCGTEYLGNTFHSVFYFDSPKMQSLTIAQFYQLSLKIYDDVPPNFNQFWTDYLRPLAKAASPSELQTMKIECLPFLWAAMIAEAMGVTL